MTENKLNGETMNIMAENTLEQEEKMNINKKSPDYDTMYMIK